MPTVGVQLQGEAVVGVVGLPAFLAPGPLKITAQQWRDIDGYQARIRSEVRRFLFRPGLDGEKDLPPFDWQEIFKELARFGGLGDDEVAAELAKKMAAFANHPRLGAPALQVVGRAIKFCQLIAPRRTQMKLGRATPITPNDMELSRFRRAFGVMNDALVVLEDLNEGTLDRRSVHTLQQVFPLTYKAIQSELMDANADILAKKPDFDMPFAKERVLGILIGSAPVAQALQRAIQQSYADSAKQAENQRQASQARRQADPSQTSAQRIANK